MTPDRRTFLSAGFGVTAAVASRTNGLMTAARAHPGSWPPTSGAFAAPQPRILAVLFTSSRARYSDPHRVPTLPA
jgi:hypothetical protein